MKKLFFLFLCTTLLACSNQEEVVDTSKTSILHISDNRSFEEALEIAENAISSDNITDVTRGIGTRKLLLEKSKIYTTSNSSSGSLNDTLLYVFNCENNQGFVIVSANRNKEGLIAVTEHGNYDPTKKTDNEGFNMYMDWVKKYLSRPSTMKGTRSSSDYNYTKIEMDTLDYTYIAPMIQVKWGQHGISGTYCSNETAGCGPVAIAQIMSHFQKPSSMIYSFPDHDVSAEYLNWFYILMHSSSTEHPAICNVLTSLDNHIGRIIREIGQRADAEYLNNGTSTSAQGLIDALEYFGYSTSGRREFHQLIEFLPELEDGKLILMWGYDNNNHGHVWVIDGGRQLKTLYTGYGSNDNTNWVQLWTSTIAVPFYHINWGFDGNYNGFFLAGFFDAADADSYDEEPIYYYGNYNYDTSLGYTIVHD